MSKNILIFMILIFMSCKENGIPELNLELEKFNRLGIEESVLIEFKNTKKDSCLHFIHNDKNLHNLYLRILEKKNMKDQINKFNINGKILELDFIVIYHHNKLNSIDNKSNLIYQDMLNISKNMENNLSMHFKKERAKEILLTKQKFNSIKKNDKINLTLYFPKKNDLQVIFGKKSEYKNDSITLSGKVIDKYYSKNFKEGYADSTFFECKIKLKYLSKNFILGSQLGILDKKYIVGDTMKLPIFSFLKF